MELGLKNKKIVISGGSKGIGFAIAQQFIAEGAEVYICARQEKGVNEAVAALGNRARGAVVDMSEPKQIESWIHQAHKEMGGIDIVVSNVSALASGTDLDTWKKAADIDLFGNIALMNAVVPYLTEQKNGNIVIISTVSAVEIDGFSEPYGSLKAALNHYGKTLALRLAGDNVRVNMVSPGNVYFKGGIWNKIETETPDFFQECLKKNPMGKMVTAEAVAESVLFLASERAEFITGTNLVIDGGLTNKVF
ncbi:NAD(P)-dependent dehydrogenase [Commensalibacter communis]|uniref:Short-chain alcohol dehydrogenase family (FabG) n=1 Tax=Commensalibacter communis TaxID=2972786 RepID=A0A9W4TLB5_9PROT|nr:SDR family oxidoreductase [Commensalibacter communis]CAI3936954.1 NAD(P)-dependent dehydrogenase [Commensalibacter communis]CAI3943324.1 NAD(P)-dependent dehydrogenase [Commensalibacter communis]CAI3943362.1 NAD(P)-dependent dehydrogenase [Commensalibacter communis]CAI3943365.1 NAD(P)-dependent dehydrogenase [Commensalibacter communis]CAI3946500.1 NAD(P)-dependent dehydrogenase [Commensalibacter communis]